MRFGVAYETIKVEYPMTFVDNDIVVATEGEDSSADVRHQRWQVTPQKESELDQMEPDKRIPEPIGGTRGWRLWRGGVHGLEVRAVPEIGEETIGRK